MSIPVIPATPSERSDAGVEIAFTEKSGRVKLDDLVKSKKYPLSLDGRGLALWSKFQYSTG
jgi:hypothetical protein